MRDSTFWKLICATLVSLLSASCVDKLPGNTGSATLYVYDGATNSIKSWNDISKIYDAGSAGTSDRTITSSLLNTNIGWGGMALDSSSQYLYLVASTGGTVVRINRVGSQSGVITSASDIFSVSLNDTSTDAQGGTFGQVTADPVNQMLYVTQATATKSQIWAVPYAQIYSGAPQINGTASGIIIGNTGQASGTSDISCTGAAAGSSGALYGFFGGGGSVSDGTTNFSGPRLRRGGSSGFSANAQVIVGDRNVTKLGVYGCLAYDTGSDLLYFARHNTASGLLENPVVVFHPGTFNPGYQVPPDATLPGPDDLRVIAHAGQKDWLVGAGSSITSNLYVWKGPSGGGTFATIPLAGVQLQGLALDGSN